MKVVDFTKKVVCSDDTIKVVQVIPVNYENTNFQHLIVYELSDGTQNHCSVNFKGVPMWGSKAYQDQLTFLNPEPKVVSAIYRNVYPRGSVSVASDSREEADSLSLLFDGDARVAVIEFLSFDDGTEKVKYIEV